MAACIGGNFEVALTLLENGASANYKTKLGKGALEMCFARLDEENNMFENKNLCLKLAELLLQYGADINDVVDNERMTLLMQFCSISIELSSFQAEVNLEVIKFLLEHGADPFKKNGKGETAIELADRHNMKDEVKKLLKEVKQKYFHPIEKTIADENKVVKEIAIEATGIKSGCFICYK